MPQYLITAYDYPGADAHQRRLDAREEHLAGARRLKEAGQLVTGGAILDAAGRMMGSMLVVDFATPAELAAWQQQEPYLLHQVWETVTILPFRTADV